MTTVPATGQFGPDQFAVLSHNLVVVDAKWLKDSTGSNYIIDQNTGRPYIVPRDYDPSVTAAYFADKFNTAQAIDNALGLGSGVSSITASMYPELYNAFKQGGWGDLQRPLAHKTEVVDAFVPAASFNLGVASKRAHQNSPSNIPEAGPAGGGMPGQSQVSGADQLATMAGDLSVAQDYENYLNNREAINALIVANHVCGRASRGHPRAGARARLQGRRMPRPFAAVASREARPADTFRVNSLNRRFRLLYPDDAIRNLAALSVHLPVDRKIQ